MAAAEARETHNPERIKIPDSAIYDTQWYQTSPTNKTASAHQYY